MSTTRIPPEPTMVLECHRADFCEAMRRAFNDIDDQHLAKSVMVPALTLLALGTLSTENGPKQFDAVKLMEKMMSGEYKGSVNETMCHEMAMVIAFSFVEFTLRELNAIQREKVAAN